jgi:hypothetical protein
MLMLMMMLQLLLLAFRASTATSHCFRFRSSNGILVLKVIYSGVKIGSSNSEFFLIVARQRLSNKIFFKLFIIGVN